MGWRISFGVGPLRYSAPLTSRRRRYAGRTYTYTTPPQYSRDHYDRRLSRLDRIMMLAVPGAVVVVMIVVLVLTA